MSVSDIKRRILNLIPDKMYLKIRYRLKRGEKLNLSHPVNYNEKLNWLKLYDRNPEYKSMVDKFSAKEFAASIIGKEHIIPNIGVWDRFEDIDTEALPDKFVLKCTHNSGGVCVCTDKASFDFQKAGKKLSEELKKDYYYFGREWVYKGIKPRILGETYMTDESGSELKDYKVFCFNGVPKMIEVIYGRYTGKSGCNLYTPDWECLDGASVHFPSDKSHVIARPDKLEEMLDYAAKLSKGIPHVRVDFYITGDTVYFGEMTFFHSNGFGGFVPKEFNKMLGDWIELPDRKHK